MKIDTTGIENDLDRETARRAFYNTSHSPERRGDRVIEDYTAEMRSLAEYIEGYAQDDRQKAIMQEVFDGLRARYREKARAWLAAQSRCISSMITGGSNFPVRRAEKANNSEHNRAQEWLEFSRNMRGYAGKALDRVFTTEEKQADAIEAMAAQLAEAQARQEFMKTANALHRKKDMAGLESLFREKYGAAGGHPRMFHEFLKPNYMNRIGFERFELSNNLANIKRMQGRLAELQNKAAMAAQTPQEGQKLHGLEIIRNHAEDRLQLVFDGKPNEAVRGLLKSHGFKWSPRFSAWQRQLTANAEAVLQDRILKAEAMKEYAA